MSDPSSLEDLFLDTLSKPTPEARAAYLDEACKDNAELRRRVEEILGAMSEAGGLLEPPAVDPFVTRLPTSEPERQGDAPPLVLAPNVGDRIGPYKLLEQIGHGGMGSVWMAEQRAPVKRLVAVKLIKAGMDSKAVLARFEAERQALALMDHPNIARVFDGGTTLAGRPFFAMELVKGLPLTDYCDSRQLSIAQRLDLFVQICAAVQHAHQKGVIHRDLKPSNVLVTEYDGRPVPKVIDFGLAKALNAASQLTERSLHTAFGTVVGTLLYMAPEQVAVNALDVDTRADIYALGVILYELLTGTTPLNRQRLSDAAWEEVQRLIREDEPPRPSARLSSSDALPSLAANRQTEPKKLTGLVRGELDWIVMKALEKDRSRRYETVNGLAMDVQRHLVGEPVLAHPPSAAYRLRKLLRRHKGPVVAASLVLLALLGGIAGTTWGMLRTEDQRQLAEKKEQEAREEKVKAEAAAEAEKQAHAQAQKRLAQIEKGNEILTSVFTDLDPRAEEKEGKPLRAILGDRLAKAAEQLEGEAVGDPLVVARLQNRLGRSLLSLGLAERAIPLFTKACATRTAGLGADHPDTLTSRNNLAMGYQHVGQLDLALPLYEETLQLQKAKLGADHLDTLGTMTNLAEGYRVAGKLDLALPLYEETFRLTKAKLGADHPDTLATMGNLAVGYQAAGKRHLALPLLEETLKFKKAKLGADHPETLQSMNNLAVGYRVAGQLDRALPLLEETLKLRQAKLGADHPETLTSMNNLALGYKTAGQLDLALPLYEESLKLRKVKLGADHPDTLHSMNNLALGYQAAGQLDLALPLLEETLKLRKIKLGADHPNTLTSMGNLASAYLAVKQPELAVPLLTTFLAGQKKQLGSANPRLANLQSSVALDLLKHHQYAPAEPILRECLAIRAKHEPDAWTTFDAQSLLGGALLGRQKYADAEPLLLQGHVGMKQRAARIPKQFRARLTEALERLVQLYDAWSKPDEALKWFKELEAHAAARQPTRKP